MTTTTPAVRRTRKAAVKPAAPVVPIVETVNPGVAGIGAALWAVQAAVNAAAETVPAIDFGGDALAAETEQEITETAPVTFTLAGSTIVGGEKIDTTVDATVPVAFVKVGARRVGKAHLIVTENDGAPVLTYVNRRGESRSVTVPQFIAIYRSGISTPIDVPVSEPVVAASVDVPAQEVADSDGPTDADLAVLAAETVSLDGTEEDTNSDLSLASADSNA